MTQKTITPENKKAPVTLKMKYNKGNQLTEMLNGRDRISYSYDPNGSMVQKVLNSQKYGTLTDSYTYDVMDQLTGYTGYDGYTQAFTYDAGGMRLKKQEKGNAIRSTLEELLRGNIEGLPEIVEPGTVEEGYEWATTEYLYDITEGYYQVLQETTTKGSEASTSSYIYGLEQIAGYTTDTKTAYIYDGRGSVAQTMTTLIAENGLSPRNDLAQETNIQSFRYTPFGEQQHTKASGFTYNAEAYDAATGMLNLRARQYEPAMNRFSQKDILNGSITSPLSLNRYGYCVNNPLEYIDPSGMASEYSDPFKTIANKMKNAIGQVVNSVKEVINNMNKKEVDDLWKDYKDKEKTLTKKEQEIINKGKKNLKKYKSGSKEYYAEMRNICTRLGEAREEIVSQQAQKREETYSEILNYSLNTTTKTVSNTIATQIATNVYESGQYWYAYGGNGSTKLPDMVDSKTFPQFNEKEYNATVTVLKGKGFTQKQIDALYGIDCMGLMKYIYTQAGVRKSPNAATSLGTTQNAFALNKEAIQKQKEKNGEKVTKADKNSKGASITNGNIYEIGTEGLIEGMTLFKYGKKKGIWQKVHIGYYNGSVVIEAKGRDFGVVISDPEEWDAYSWMDGISLDEAYWP